jgi:hypothetical protein
MWRLASYEAAGYEHALRRHFAVEEVAPREEGWMEIKLDAQLVRMKMQHDAQSVASTLAAQAAEQDGK